MYVLMILYSAIVVWLVWFWCFTELLDFIGLYLLERNLNNYLHSVPLEINIGYHYLIALFNCLLCMPYIIRIWCQIVPLLIIIRSRSTISDSRRYNDYSTPLSSMDAMILRDRLDPGPQKVSSKTNKDAGVWNAMEVSLTPNKPPVSDSLCPLNEGIAVGCCEEGYLYPLIPGRLFFTTHRDDNYTMEQISTHRKNFYFSSEMPEVS